MEGVHNSAITSIEDDTGVGDEMKNAAASEDDSDSNCSDDVDGNNQNTVIYLVIFRLIFHFLLFLVSELDDEEKEYAVDKILDRRLVVDGPNPTPECYEYLVAWKDCSEEEDSWEPYENVKKCQMELEEFHQRLNKKKKESSF